MEVRQVGFKSMLCGAIACLSLLAPSKPPTGTSANLASKSLVQLFEGNKRFFKGHMEHPNQTPERRREVAKGQKPFATILDCADSRLPPELIFDQGLGDLFVVRVAGNVVDDDGLGSIEYAVKSLGTPLVVVLGHKECGAVSAAAEAAQGKHIGKHLNSITNKIAPLYRIAKRQPGDPVDNLIRLNVLHVVKLLKTSKPILAEMVREGKVKIVGACYDLDSGRVELLK